MSHRRNLPIFALVALLPTLAAPLLANGDVRDWPLWSGPEHNLTSLGNGAFGDAEVGLETAWRRPLGSAYSGVAVVDGRAITAFSDGAGDFLVALAADDGRELWRYRIGDVYEGHDGSDDGPIATPTVAGGRVFGVGPWGHLFAVRLDDGGELWSHHLAEELGARQPDYGFSTSPLVVGGVVVVQTGAGEGGAVSGFDPATGERLWATGDDRVGYQSPIAFEVGGEPQVVAVTNSLLTGLDPATGEELWRHQHKEPSPYDGFSHPVRVGEDRILLNYWPESALFRVTRSDGGDGVDDGGYAVEELWRSRALKGTYGSSVPYDGHLYGFSGRFLTCVDAATGETVWKSRPPGGGNLVLVDGHLVIQSPDGEVVVAEATPEGYREKARVAALDSGSLTRPSFAGGRVYVRNLEEIASVAVTDRAPAAPARVAEAEIPEEELRGDFGTWIAELCSAPAAERPARVEAYLAERESFPIQERDGDRVLAHFVYRGDVPDLGLGGNLVSEQLPMHHVDGTDLYFRTVELEPASHYVYRFYVFEEQKLDPRNPHRFGSEDREHSELTTLGWSRPGFLGEPEGPRGRLEELTWKSEILGNERTVQLYLPPGYDDGEERYPLLVVHHGDRALAEIGMDAILDHLVGDAVRPVIVAFAPRLGWTEYAGSETDRYVRALTEELVPRIDDGYRTVAEPGSRAVMGPGSGAFPTVWALFHPSGVFGKGALFSFYQGDLEAELFELIERSEERQRQIYLEWSRFQPGETDSAGDSRELVAALAARGHEPTTVEVGDGYGWGMWRQRLDQILGGFFPAE